MNPMQAVMRRFGAYQGKSQIDLRGTNTESVAVDQVSPSGLELTRAGRRFYIGNNAAITGIAPVQALPTTTPQWGIYNADPKKTIFFETLGVYCTSGTPGVGGILLACLYQLPAPGAPTAGVGISSASGMGIAAAPLIIVKSSPGAITQPATPNWFQVAENLSPNVGAFPGSAAIINRGIAGRVAIQPGWGLGLVVLALAGTTPLFAPMAEGVLLETDNE